MSASFDSSQTPSTGAAPGPARLVIVFAGFGALAAAALFGSAGRVDWPTGWVYLAFISIITIGSRLLMARVNPSLVAERGRLAEHPAVKGWDRLLMPFVAFVGPFAVWVVAGLNQRWDWAPDVPFWLQIIGFALLAFGGVVSTWAMIANRFFSAVVRIQRDRGHQVVSDGPYRYVRHPGYAGSAAAWLGSALCLGSWWAFAPASLLIAALVVRTALEDRTLQAELGGYRDYARRVRYRLIPGVW